MAQSASTMSSRFEFRTLFTLAMTASTVAGLLLATACTFDNEPLDERRCLNDAACSTRFGDRFMCIRQYCQEVGAARCESDQDCQDRDGFFCNGAETCAEEGTEGADDFGCLPGDPDALIDDGVACTNDLCDENRPNGQKIINDPAGCECQDDFICSSLNSDPCVTSTCDRSTFTCTNTNAEEGAGCNDGLDCTTETVCMGGVCVFADGGAGLDDTICQDGSFCNGEEICDPENVNANPVTGCIAGTPPASLPEFDDSIACTVPACVEGNTPNQGSVGQDPRGCACTSPDDCRAMTGTCQVFKCDAETSYTCQPVGDELVPDGEGCNDGKACTTQDTCTVQGTCEGRRVHLYCETILDCAEGSSARCNPDNIDADANSGCICQ